MAFRDFLEWLKIPYTGSGVFASAAAMDKKASKRLFDAAKLPTAPLVCSEQTRPLTKAECPPLTAGTGLPMAGWAAA